MKKRILLLLLLLWILCSFTGCNCEHEWQEADCYTPKTCILCGTREGVKLEHDWLPPTCTAPETCSRCGETDGESLKHTFVAATCSESVRCTLCGMTMGEPKGHELGEWEILEQRRIEGTQDERLLCLVCGEILDSRTVPLPKLHDGSQFILTPVEFSIRLENILDSYEDNALQIWEGDDEKRYENIIGSDEEKCGSVRYRKGLEFIGSEAKDTLCFNGVLCAANGNNSIVRVLTAVVQTCDPTLGFEDAKNVASHLLESGKRTINGITYSYNIIGSSALLSAVVEG